MLSVPVDKIVFCDPAEINYLDLKNKEQLVLKSLISHINHPQMSDLKSEPFTVRELLYMASEESVVAFKSAFSKLKKKGLVKCVGLRECTVTKCKYVEEYLVV